jgi:hypothetical protein
MALVYKHIRKDTNEVFYIGIGKDNKRPYHISHRSNRWKLIVNKTDYEVQIIEDNLTWEEACEKEKYWIKFYGRKDLNEGNLVNMTDGGDGTMGHSLTTEHINKIKTTLKGRVFTDEHKQKLSEIGKSKYKAGEITNINWKGRKHKETSKLKISENHADVSGSKNPFFGKKHTEETKQKIRESKLLKNKK